MPTPTKFTGRRILDAALVVVGRDGVGASVGSVAAELGAPTGSIYHRFPSKDILLGELWLETVADFQAGFFDALDGEDVDGAGLAAALWTPQWARTNPLRARLLLVHRREDFLTSWPEEMGERARSLGSDVERGLRTFAGRLFGSAARDAVRRVRFVLVDVPYGATRRYVVTERKPPPSLDELIRTTFEAVVGGRVLRPVRTTKAVT